VHILFLSDNFPPEVNAPASRTFEHCRLWAQAGHRVTVITCAPNFPKGTLFPGYKNSLWQTEMMDGVRVVRVWSYITTATGMRARFMDYNSYVVMAGIASLFVGRVDVLVGTSPQFFTAIGAWIIGMVKRSPWIFELRDIWPESIKAVGEMKNSPRALRWLENIELFLYRRADRIVSVTHSFRRVLGTRGIDTNKIDVVTNGIDVSRFAPRPKDQALLRETGLEGHFVAGYIGTHGMAHALETLLEAAKQLKNLPGGQDIKILFLGDGTRKEALKQQALEMELDNVVFIDSVAKDEVVRYWSVLDVSIIHLRKSELFTTVIPSKLFECMGMGIPVLHGVAGESADIVVREGIGQLFEPESVEQLVQGLLKLRADPVLLDSMSQSGPKAALRYDRKNLGMEMLDVLEAVSRSRPHPASRGKSLQS
jgi:glycosyltransferase involved in cell wall biosynthesis